MGTYAECWLGSFYVKSTRGDVDPGLMALFRATDKHVVTTPGARVPRLLRTAASEIDFEGGELLVYYTALVAVVKDRLEVMGYTLTTCEAAFSSCISAELQRHQEILDDPQRLGNMEEYYRGHSKLLKELTPRVWIEALKVIRKQDLQTSYHGRGKYHGSTIGFMLENEWYGYLGPNPNVGLRLAIEACEDNDEFVYDLTELVMGGFLHRHDDQVARAIARQAHGYALLGKTLILTEGLSDTRILSESLQLLFPHLTDFFGFMDFQAFRVPGGSGSLANLTKSMAAAGVVNKTIALFDNDTAARSALRGLKAIDLPRNILLLQLPELDLLRNYPTLGPTGPVDMDINGIAASIELYLGRDVLVDTHDGRLLPIQWTGYDSGVGKYQGEIVRKSEIQDRFSRKVYACRSNPELMKSLDWEGMRALWSCIFCAFHEIDGEEIRCDVLQYANPLLLK